MFEIPVRVAIDSNMWMAGSKAYGVAPKLYRCLPHVLYRSLFFCKKRVYSVGRKEHEETATPKILHVCEPRGLSPGPLELRKVNAVFRDELFIDCRRVFSFRNKTGDVKPVAVRDVAYGELLNKALNRSCLIAIFHRSSPPVVKEGCSNRQLFLVSASNLSRSISALPGKASFMLEGERSGTRSFARAFAPAYMSVGPPQFCKEPTQEARRLAFATRRRTCARCALSSKLEVA